MNPVVHFEIPGDNPQRMADFYAQAFGWKMQTLGPEMGGYIMTQTAPTNENGLPEKLGTINGGLYQRTEDPNTQHPSFVVQVEELPAAMEAIKKAGGQVLSEPMPIPGVGEFVSARDTEGNYFAILKPVAEMA